MGAFDKEELHQNTSSDAKMRTKALLVQFFHEKINSEAYSQKCKRSHYNSKEERPEMIDIQRIGAEIEAIHNDVWPKLMQCNLPLPDQNDKVKRGMLDQISARQKKMYQLIN